MNLHVRYLVGKKNQTRNEKEIEYIVRSKTHLK